MDTVLLGILGYVLAQLGIGFWVSRRIRSEADYLIAGRRLGYGLATFSIFATWFGAETCIGAAGVMYTDGLSGATADPFGYGLCILFMALVYAVPLRRLQLTTPADFFRQRFGPDVERIVVLLMIPTSLLWAAAQVRAFGQVLSASSGLTTTTAIAAAAVVVIAYTTFGGLLADAWTDLVQGLALAVGLVLLLGFVLSARGMEAFTAIPPERLALFGPRDTPAFAILERWAIPVIGSVSAAELVTRILASRSPTVAQRGALMACGLYVVLGMIPVLVGLAGPALLADVADPEHFLPRLAQRHLPAPLYPLFAGALVSAILSTVDSNLLVSASLLSHNVIVPLRRGMGEAQKIRIARFAVVLFGALAFVLALFATGVYALVEAASAFGSAGIFVVMTLGLFTRRGGRASALAALLTGALVWCAGEFLHLVPYPYLTSLAAALVAYGAVAAARRNVSPRTPPRELP